METAETRFWSRVRKTDGCWFWTGAQFNGGYGVFSLDGRPRRAHRVAWEMANGPIPDALVVRHFVCDTPACVRPDHLRLGTRAENTADMVAKGRQSRGASHGSKVRAEMRPRGVGHRMAKLTDKLVREMRAFYWWGEPKTSLARLFGVSIPTVTQVVTRTTWRHVND